MSDTSKNQELKKRLHDTINSRFFHACIIAGGKNSGRHELAGYLTSAAVCTADIIPCGKCTGCIKAEKGIHPDVITVKRQGGGITAEQVRSLRTSVFIRSNEAPRRVVIIDEAETMNLYAQNALLNILEEPPSDVLFILITENESALLETVRSRCVLLRTAPGINDVKPNEQVSAVASAVAKRDAAAIVFAAAPLEKMKREEQSLFFEGFLQLMRDAAVIKYGYTNDVV